MDTLCQNNASVSVLVKVYTKEIVADLWQIQNILISDSLLHLHTDCEPEKKSQVGQVSGVFKFGIWSEFFIFKWMFFSWFNYV